jgi:hypothetical protein
MLIKDDVADLLSISQSLINKSVRSSQRQVLTAQCTKNQQPARAGSWHGDCCPAWSTGVTGQVCPGRLGSSVIEISRKSALQSLPFMCSVPPSQLEHFSSGPRRASGAAGPPRGAAGGPGPAPAGRGIPAGGPAVGPRGPGPRSESRSSDSAGESVAGLYNRQIRNRTRTELEPPRRAWHVTVALGIQPRRLGRRAREPRPGLLGL